MSTTSSTRVVIGPMTTIFTPPAPCFTDVAVGTYPGAPHIFAFPNQECDDSNNFNFATTCWPPFSYPNLVDMGASVALWGFYSPAFSCPSGYVSAASATASGSSNYIPTYSMLPDETAVACCFPYVDALILCRHPSPIVTDNRTTDRMI